MVYLTIVSMVFVLLTVFLEICHRAERKELYDRLMCRDASEYGKLRQKKSGRADAPYVVSAKKWRDTERRDNG